MMVSWTIESTRLETRLKNEHSKPELKFAAELQYSESWAENRMHHDTGR